VNWSESSSQILGVGLTLLWCVGFFLMAGSGRSRQKTLGKSKDPTTSVTAIAAITIFLIVLAVDYFFLSRDGNGIQKIWGRGWIGQHDLPGAITVGILEDSLGLVLSGFVAVLTLCFLGFTELISSENRPNRVYVGGLLSVAGVSLAWLSSTPWLSLLGVGISTLSGFVALGTLSNEESAEKISQFGRERTFGLVLAVLGAAVLAGQRIALTLDHGFSLPAQNLGSFFDWAGGALLVLGLYLHLQPFPFLGWLAESSEEPSAASILINQVFPAVGAFAILIRFEPELRSIGLLPIVGGYALVSSFLAVCSGLAQSGWKKPLSLWVSASFSMAFAALCWAGPSAAVLILIAASIAGLGLACLGRMKDLGFRSGAVQTAIIMMALAAGGLPGFVGLGGYIRLLVFSASDPARVSAAAVVLLGVFLLLWKVSWAILRTTEKVESPEKKTAIIPAYVLVILALGVLWTGALSGGVVPHDPDHVMPSWLNLSMTQAFGSSPADWADDAGANLGVGLYGAIAALAAILSFWLCGRQDDLWLGLFGKSEKVSAFFRSGYRLDRTGAKFVRVLNLSGGWIESFVGERLGARWIPQALAASVRVPAVWLDRVNVRVHEQSGTALQRAIEVPGKLLQLIQNGNVQWYLFFALSCTFAILIHFLRA
jgi:hypothetical protein